MYFYTITRVPAKLSVDIYFYLRLVAMVIVFRGDILVEIYINVTVLFQNDRVT